MSTTYDIRPLSEGDRPHWGGLWERYLAFYGATRPKQQYDLTFARYLDPGRTDMAAWMAWDGAKPIGLVHAIAHAHGWEEAPVTYLQDLFTVEGARGRGVGRALIQTVYDDADAAGRPKVYWLTQIGNAKARALYDKVAQPTDFMKYSRV